jgi:hypothetical protein
LLCGYRYVIFVQNEDMKLWKIASDSDENKGFSTVKLERTERGTALFSGALNTIVPKVSLPCFTDDFYSFV